MPKVLTSKNKNGINNDRVYWYLLISVWMIYVCTMIAKSIYNAEIIEIMNAFKVNKTVAGYATTAYYLTYGFMQLVIAKILPKIDIRKYIVITVSLAAVCTALVGAVTEIWHIWILLALDGIFHAAVWPGCVLIVGKYLPVRMQASANALLSVGFATGFILSYLFSALFIGLGKWELTFWIFGLITLIPVLLFNISLKKVEKTSENVQESDKTSSSSEFNHLNHKLIQRYLTVFFITICVTSFLVNIVYYGVNNWIPNLMYDVFSVPSSVSTLVSVLVPIAGIAGPLIAIRLTSKHNLWYVSAGITSVSVVLLFAMIFGYNTNIIFSLTASIVLLTALRGTNNTIATSLVLKTRNLFNAGSFAAIINALASLGASVAPPLTGRIIDAFGGDRTMYYIILLVVLFASVVLMFVLNRLTKRLRVLRKSVLTN